MNKTVLIFGSSGFIGNALVSKFKSEKFKVIGCDLINLNNPNIDIFISNTQFNNNPVALFKYDFTICVNCAGAASVPFSFQEPFKDYELNTRIVFQLLDEIKKQKSDTRFLNLSSAAVYGNPAILPINENATLKPISPYGNHKLMSEMIINQFRDYFNLDAYSLRIFSAFGPGLKKQIFWDIYQKALINDVIPMHGNGKESRDFIYIDDLVEAIFLICVSNKLQYPVYNIANGVAVTIADILNEFCVVYPGNKKYKFNGEVRLGDPLNWCADISRLTELGYTPKVKIADGIRRYVEWITKK